MTKTNLLITFAAPLLFACIAPSDDDILQGSGGSGGSGVGGGPGGPSQGGSGQGGSNAFPDLSGVAFELWPVVAGTEWSNELARYRSSVTVCMNSNGDFGNFVSVANTGLAPVERRFEVAIGLYNESDGAISMAPDTLLSDATLAPGRSITWDHEMCTTIDVAHDPAETHRLFVAADADSAIAEPNEENNVAFSSEPLLL